MKKVNLENPSFVEEIPSSLVDPDDFYKMQKSKKRRIIYVIIFFLILILFTGLFYGFLYKTSKDAYPGFEIGQDLIVVHSKTEFGDNISLSSYNSYANAYTYHFYLENKNELDIPYMIYFESLNNNVDLSKVNYAILKDEEIIFQGVIGNENSKIVANKITGSSIHHYSLKLWSTESNGNLDFRINVEVA